MYSGVYEGKKRHSPRKSSFKNSDNDASTTTSSSTFIQVHTQEKEHRVASMINAAQQVFIIDPGTPAVRQYYASQVKYHGGFDDWDETPIKSGNELDAALSAGGGDGGSDDTNGSKSGRGYSSRRSSNKNEDKLLEAREQKPFGCGSFGGSLNLRLLKVLFLIIPLSLHST